MIIRLRTLALLLALCVAATACSVDVGQITPTVAGRGTRAVPESTQTAGAGDTSSSNDVLPTIGPAPGSSHWHAAYVVRICDDVLVPFESTADPLGIHSHADGLIHVHPFFEESGFEASTISLFTDAMGMGLETGELTLPGGGTWRDGDLCNGVPGRVFVDRWPDPMPDGAVERIFDDPDEVRFEADGELYQIAFAPIDSPPVVPPTWSLLYEVSNLNLEPGDPWVSIDAAAPADSAFLWTVAEVTAMPCVDGQVEESVLVGEGACFTPTDDRFKRSDAVVDARAVTFNRRPAVELTITPAFRAFLVNQFAPGSPATETGIVIAIEVDGNVVTAPLMTRPSASAQRFVLAGGLSVESAQALATVLAG